MIFKFPPRMPGPFNIKKYIIADLWNWLLDLSNGLTRLRFNENFETFTINDLFIKAGTEVSIANAFIRSGSGVPTGYIVVRSSGTNTITDGDTPWSSGFVTLKNVGSVDATITVIFFR